MTVPLQQQRPAACATWQEGAFLTVRSGRRGEAIGEERVGDVWRLSEAETRSHIGDYNVV